MKTLQDLLESSASVDTITMDIPLLIRILEYVHEDVRNDEEIHKLVSNMLNNKNKVLNMDDYRSLIRNTK